MGGDNDGGGVVAFLMVWLVLRWWWLVDAQSFFDLFYLFLFLLLLLWYQVFRQLIVNSDWRKGGSGWFLILLLLIYLIGVYHSLDFKYGIWGIATTTSSSILLKRIEWGFPLDKFICCLLWFLKRAIEPKHVVATVWWHVLCLHLWLSHHTLFR